MKWRVNRAVKRSTLPPPSRLLMFVLSDRADAKTAVIPTEYSPSVNELAEETGLGEATVKRHLASLETLGWIARERPTAEQMARHIPGTYRLMIGSGPDEQPGAHGDPPNNFPEGSQGAPVGGSERPPAGAQSEPSEDASGAQSEPTGGSERYRPGDQSEPPSYLDDRNDLDDQVLGADAPSDESDGTLFGSDTEGVEKRPAKKAASKPKRTKKPEPQRDDVDALCARLYHLMIANGCKPPKITENWKTEARLLLDRDGRDLADALNVLEWSQYSRFWKTNIHSIPTFREQYDKLRQQRDNEREALAAAGAYQGSSPAVPGQYGGNVTPLRPRPSTTDQRVAQGLALADYYRSRGE